MFSMGVGKPGRPGEFQCQLCQQMAVWPWAAQLRFPGQEFFIYTVKELDERIY